MQVLIHEHSIWMTAPYFREHAGAIRRLAPQYVDVLGNEAGYVACDRQLGRIVSPSDLSAVRVQYHSSVEDVPDRTP